MAETIDFDGMGNSKTLVIEPSAGWVPLKLRELWDYRTLLYFLVWRDIKVQYAQSVLGVAWAVLQPVVSMIVFTVIFGNLAQISSDGVPYAIFSYTALVPWSYFDNALSGASNSLIAASGILTKVYFPRLIIPLAPVLGKLVDFGIAMLLLGVLMLWFRATPTIWVILLPLLILLMVLTAAGIGMWVTALAVQYRDIRHGMQFAVKLFMYAAPVVYPASAIPDRYRLLYGLNPMAGVIEGFRASLLATRPMPWDLILVGTCTAVVIAVSGAVYFRRMESIFADVV